MKTFMTIFIILILSIYYVPADINEKLYDAIEQEDLGQINELISLGADLNYRDNNGWTPLMWAVLNNRGINVVSLLLDHKTDIHKKDPFKMSVILWAAAFNNHLDVMEFLLQKGAKLEDRDKDEWTPLMKALRYNDEKMIGYLINRGADIQAVTERTSLLTPLMIALANNRDIKIIQLLIDLGSNVNQADNWWKTPLMWAAMYHQDPNVIKLLIDSGADVNWRSYNKQNALDYAMEHNKNKKVILVLEKAIKQ